MKLFKRYPTRLELLWALILAGLLAGAVSLVINAPMPTTDSACRACDTLHYANGRLLVVCGDTVDVKVRFQ